MTMIISYQREEYNPDSSLAMTSSRSQTNDYLAGNHVWSTMERGDRGPTVWRIVSRRHSKHLPGPRQISRVRSLLHGPADYRRQDATARASSSSSLPNSDQLALSAGVIGARIQRDIIRLPPLGHHFGRPGS